VSTVMDKVVVDIYWIGFYSLGLAIFLLVSIRERLKTEKCLGGFTMKTMNISLSD
jgi:hypothetical protein